MITSLWTSPLTAAVGHSADRAPRPDPHSPAGRETSAAGGEDGALLSRVARRHNLPPEAARRLLRRRCFGWRVLVSAALLGWVYRRTVDDLDHLVTELANAGHWMDVQAGALLYREHWVQRHGPVERWFFSFRVRRVLSAVAGYYAPSGESSAALGHHL